MDPRSDPLWTPRRPHTESVPVHTHRAARGRGADNPHLSPQTRAACGRVGHNGLVRLHIPAIPHTITGDARFSHCAFAGKVARFAPMMATVTDADGAPVYEVYHYGVEGAVSGADVDVQLLSAAEWAALRVATYQQLHPDASDAAAAAALENPAAFVGDMARMGTPLYDAFNARLRDALATYFRSNATDLLCLPFGPAHDGALVGAPSYARMESGIGYSNAVHDVRVMESFAWYHWYCGKEGKHGQNYWFVAPNYFDAAAWPLGHGSGALDLDPEVGAPAATAAATAVTAAGPTPAPAPQRRRPRVGFFGRLCAIKGVDIVVEAARRLPEADFVLCGQGDPSPYLAAALPNLAYEPPKCGTARADFLGSLDVLLAPSVFVEPFCGVATEAQLCGTPVVAPAYGATTETVVHGVSGLLAHHTLGDLVAALRDALAPRRWDRAAIRARAVARYGLPAVGRTYHAIIATVLDYFAGAGWYTTTPGVPLPTPY